MVELLLSRGADHTICDDGIGWTPLIEAAYSGHVDVMQCLVGNKAVRATIDVQDKIGITAIWSASVEGHAEIVKLLVDAGANPMVANRHGHTPLDIARIKGHGGCIAILEVSLKALVIVS